MNKKKIVISVEIGTLILIIAVFLCINFSLDAKRRKSFVPVPDTNEYAYQIEKIFIENDRLMIKGWFFELDSVRNVKKNIEDGKQLGILLYEYDEHNMNSKENEEEHVGIEAEVSCYERADVNDYFLCNNTNCGFIASIDMTDIDYNNKTYQILIKPEICDEIAIATSTYIDCGVLSYVNPNSIIQLEVEGTDLDKIVNDGVCLASNPQFDVSVYQYNWNLYWIAGPDYEFEEDDSTYIQYHLDTTQIEKLSNERIANGWYWSDLGDDFEKHEITFEMDCGNYRVSTREIPSNYAVSYIITGYSLEETYIWKNVFRPCYSFES